MSSITEKEKYLRLYSDIGELLRTDPSKQEWNTGGYGRNCWGSGIINFLYYNDAQRICDVGCGYGYFCNICTTFAGLVVGVDIASVEKGQVISNPEIIYVSAPMDCLPMNTGCVEWSTAFDVLEHIPIEDIDKSLDEMRRIATVGMVFTISDIPCNVYGFNLHVTVKPRSWWIEKLRKYGMVQQIGRDPYRGDHYLVVRFLNI